MDILQASYCGGWPDIEEFEIECFLPNRSSPVITLPMMVPEIARTDWPKSVPEFLTRSKEVVVINKAKQESRGEKITYEDVWTPKPVQQVRGVRGMREGMAVYKPFG